MKISDLVLLRIRGRFPPPDLLPEERIASPLDVYPEFGGAGLRRPTPKEGDLAVEEDVSLEVRTDEGVVGLFGPVDGAHSTVLRREMREFVVGRDPLATEAIWDLLLRRNRHARSGYYLMAMSALDCAWEGVRFSEVVELASPTERARFVTIGCEGGYSTSLPLADLLAPDVLLAWGRDGKALTPEHGYPLRLVVPHRYAYKSAKWVRRICFTQEQELGYWESRGYSNSADPWKEERRG